MVSTIDEVLQSNIDRQSPLLLQPIWKTKGKSPALADYCLDAFVWSDFAFTRLFVDATKKELNGKSLRVPRYIRSVLWLARMLCDYASTGRFNHGKIIDELSLGHQTDKAFAVNGRGTYRYLSSPILKKPRIHKKQIKEIILGGGQDFLSPERRFDAIIKNTPGLFD